MKTYQLESVEQAGNRYTSCTLVVDEQTRVGQIRRVAGLISKKESTVGVIGSGANTKVYVEGRQITLGDTILIAMNESNAVEIAKIFATNPAATPAVDYAAVLKKLATELLQKRGAVVGFLSTYSSSPREALFSLSGSWSGSGAGPLPEYIQDVQGELFGSLEKLKSAMSEDVKTHGTARTERICAFMYAACVVQGSILNGDVTDGATGLFQELGIGWPENQKLNARELTGDLLRRAANIFENR